VGHLIVLKWLAEEVCTGVGIVGSQARWPLSRQRPFYIGNFGASSKHAYLQILQHEIALLVSGATHFAKIVVIKVEMNDQMADIFVKGLGGTKFEEMRYKRFCWLNFVSWLKRECCSLVNRISSCDLAF
jgi:hypothetical protein